MRCRLPGDKRAGKNRRRKNVRGTRAEILVGAQRPTVLFDLRRLSRIASKRINPDSLAERESPEFHVVTKILSRTGFFFFFFPFFFSSRDGPRGGSVAVFLWRSAQAWRTVALRSVVLIRWISHAGDISPGLATVLCIRCVSTRWCKTTKGCCTLCPIAKALM